MVGIREVPSALEVGNPVVSIGLKLKGGLLSPAQLLTLSSGLFAMGLFKCRYEDDMPVDAYNKACEIRTCTFKRPHMRGFWFATIGFFVAFVGWFAMAPIGKTIKKEVGISKSEWYNSNILAVSATIFARVVIGPLCDRFGARRPMAGLLLVCSIPLACAAAIQNAAGLYIVRLLIGIVGATFVPCQFWTTSMFTGSIVGQANAMAGGWGNLGGGVTQATSPLFYLMFQGFGCSDDLAWRLSLQIPVVVWIVVAVLMLKFSDDCPEGRWKNRKVKPQTVSDGSQVKGGPCRVLTNYVTWILVVLYACCFGVELYVNGTMSSYLQDYFDLDQTVAGLVASLFGLMNLFARAVGGWASDKAATRLYLRGRFIVLGVCIAGTGGMLIVYSTIRALWLAIVMLIVFSCFVQASEGATFGVVPFVDSQYTGIVSGLVGAGGNLGAMCWGFVHKAFGENDQEHTAYLVVGFICLGSSCLTLLIRLHGASTLPCLGNSGEAVEKALSQSEAQKNAEAMGELPGAYGGSGPGVYATSDAYGLGYAAQAPSFATNGVPPFQPAPSYWTPQGPYPPTNTPQSPFVQQAGGGGMNAFNPGYPGSLNQPSTYAAPYTIPY